MIAFVLPLQVATFVVLGGYFLATGDVRLGLSQLLLATVQALVYA